MKTKSMLSSLGLSAALPLMAAVPPSHEILLHDADGKLLPGVAAHACYFDDVRKPERAIDGSGLTPDGNGGYTCTTTAADNMWMGAGGDTKYSRWFVIDFGKEIWLDRFDLWNFNMNNGADYSRRGIRYIAVYTSVKDSVTLPKVQTGSQTSPNEITWEPNDDWTLNKSGSDIGELKQATGKTDYSTPNHITLNPVKTRWLGLKLGGVFSTTSKNNGGYGGISELQFFYDDYAAFTAKEPSAVAQTSATLVTDFALKAGVESADVTLVYGTTAGGDTVGSWQHAVTQSDAVPGDVSFVLSELTGGTVYSYAFCCVDKAHGNELVWSETQSFVTLSDCAARLDGVSNATAQTIDYAGTLFDVSGTGAEVFIAYDKTAGGTVPSSWEHVKSIGVKEPGAFSGTLTGLDPDSTYSVAFFVGSTENPIWSVTQSFTTKKSLTVTDFAVTAVTTGSATFATTVASVLGGETTVKVAYGTSDGGETPEGWEYVVERTISTGTETPVTLEGLTADTLYSARLFTSEGTFGPVVRLSTGAVSLTMPASFYETDATPRRVIFTRPASCAGEAWTVRYEVTGSAAEDYAELMPGEVVFAEGQSEVVITLTPVVNASAEATVLSVRLLAGDCALADAAVQSTTILDGAGLVGADVSWMGTAEDGLWMTPGNWSLERLPIYLDTVTIATACSAESPVVVKDENVTVTKLTLGPTDESLGVVRVQDGVELKATNGAFVGGETSAGAGHLSVAAGSNFTVGGANLTFGATAGSSGTAEIAGTLTMLAGKDLVVGAFGTSALTLTESGKIEIGISGQKGALFLGYNTSGSGTLNLSGEAYVGSGYTTRIGEYGYGELNLADNATFNNSSKGGITLGNQASGHGKITMTGGKVSGSSNIGIIGNAGTGELYVRGGEFNTRGVRIGAQAGSYGYVEVDEGASLSTGTTGYNLEIGGSGTGILKMRGGTAYYSKSGAVKIRTAAAGTGLLTGWGTVQCSSTDGTLYNNGIVRADSEGDESRALSISHRHSYIYNEIENDSTNGWYAVNKGRLGIGAQNVSLAVNEGVTYFNWGESANDEEIDLVNSVRFGFSNITSAVALNTGRIYAPDRSSEVPALPSGKTVAGVWKFDITGAYESASVQFRYDHVLAPRGVQLYQLDADGATWRKLETRLLSGYRAEVTVTDASRMFAAVADHPGLVIIIQ